MVYCIFCLRTLAGIVPTGTLPLCVECQRQLGELPPADRMKIATEAAGVIERRRHNDCLHMLAIQFGELIDTAKERAE